MVLCFEDTAVHTQCMLPVVQCILVGRRREEKGGVGRSREEKGGVGRVQVGVLGGTVGAQRWVRRWGCICTVVAYSGSGVQW